MKEGDAFIQQARWRNRSYGVPLRGTSSTDTVNVDPDTGEYGLADGGSTNRTTVNLNDTLQRLWFQS